MEVSIFIPTLNAGKRFKDVLTAIFTQKGVSFEVIIVDSGSTDCTLDIIKEFNIRLYRISRKEFGHGKTRNLAIQHAKGGFIVFLSQDAIPANAIWLRSMLDNFISSKVAGVFSKQIPYKNSMENERFFYSEHFHNKKVIRPLKNTSWFIDNIFFSNVSSCVRKKIFCKYPFDETLIMSEDQQWAKEVIHAGYNTIYEPKSIVIHSHNYSLKQTFQRYFDSAFSLQCISHEKFKNFTRIGAGYITREFVHVLKVKPSLIPYLILHNISKIIGTTLGIHHRFLPVSIKRMCSMHKYYWK